MSMIEKEYEAHTGALDKALEQALTCWCGERPKFYSWRTKHHGNIILIACGGTNELKHNIQVIYWLNTLCLKYNEVSGAHSIVRKIGETTDEYMIRMNSNPCDSCDKCLYSDELITYDLAVSLVNKWNKRVEKHNAITNGKRCSCGKKLRKDWKHCPECGKEV